MSKINMLTGYIVLALLLTGLLCSQADGKDMCVECHKDTKFLTQNRTLYDYYKGWQNSTHDIAEVTCRDCHGGDPAKSDKEGAHGNDFLSFTAPAASSYKEIPQRCGACHEAVLEHFITSRHYRVLLDKGKGPHCATCHGAMNVHVYYTSVITRTCKNCHNEYTKISPEIVGEADKILHRINVSHALKKWVLMDYYNEFPVQVEEILALYSSVTESWHSFDFKALDRRSEELLRTIRSFINRDLMAEKGGTDKK